MNEFADLYKKFLEGQCTGEEKERLLALQHQLDFVDDHSQLTEEERAIKLETYHQIAKTISRRPVRLKYWYYAAAASVLVLACLIWLLMDSSPKTPAKGNDIVKVDTVRNGLPKPGGQAAILTLGDGSQVRLDKVQTGVLTANGASFVQKVTNGHLVYNANEAAVTFNTITVPRGNLFRLTLPDGTEVWLNAETRLIFPTRFTGAERQVELQGEAYFEVAKNTKMPFRVKASGTMVEVLGTHFNVSAYPEEKQVKTTLLEGSVKLSNHFTQTVIQPGQEGSLAQNSNKVTVAQARSNEAIAWKDGYFIFHDESLINIMKRAERWYDVDVEFEGDVTGYQFGGSISKYQDISELLHIIELTKTIHYKIEGRRITIMK
jgi:transmembrane sensor